MTVINALKFNDKSGGMVADSQSSDFSTNRKYDLADKVMTFSQGDTFVLAGGTGRADLLYEAGTRLQDLFGEMKGYSFRDFAYATSDLLISMKRERIETRLKSVYGISGLEAVTGQKIVDEANSKTAPIDPEMLKQIREEYKAHTEKSSGFFGGNAFLMIGKDKSGVNLYTVPMGTAPFLSSDSYLSLGSGSDESDKRLYHFLKDIVKEKRSEVDFIKGMAALIRATTASSDLNLGVGGVPSIHYFNERGMKSLGEEESRFAVELIKVGDAGLISPDKMHEALESLILQAAKVEALNESVFRESKNCERIMMFLRGYK